MNRILESQEFQFSDDLNEEEIKYLQAWLAFGRACAGMIVRITEDPLGNALFGGPARDLLADITDYMTEHEDLDKTLTRKLVKAQHILDTLEEPWSD